MIQRRRVGERAGSDGIGNDVVELAVIIAHRSQGLRHHPVDDLEIAAAGQFLEFHQGKIRLDARGIAIHDQANGAGGGDDRGLSIPITVLLAEVEGKIPAFRCCRRQFPVRAIRRDEGDGRDG